MDRRLEERKELFEPPAEVSPAEFSARLEEDEELLNEIRERFQQGRTSGRFPALSELLSHLSVKEPEKFFKTGDAKRITLSRAQKIRVSGFVNYSSCW
jgi:hypothetical protein